MFQNGELLQNFFPAPKSRRPLCVPAVCVMLLAARRGALQTRRALPLFAARALSAQAAAGSVPTLDTPFISDTIPLAEGVLGSVEEIIAEVGQSVDENEVVAVVETDKVSLEIRASRPGVIARVLVAVGDEVKEQQPIFELQP